MEYVYCVILYHLHRAISLLIKTDIDAVIKGNQWPLSTYGPFKDRTSLPNFIADQSFEELRAAAYEAKTHGTLPTLSAQIAQSRAEATLRMQQLYELNGDSMNMLVSLYNSTMDGGANMGNPNNPFTKVNNPSVAHTNPFGSKPLIQANPFASGSGGGMVGQPSTGSSLFGTSSMSGAQQSNPFASSGAAVGNIFGAPAAPNTSASGNIFGGGGGSMAATSSAATTSMFSGGSTTFASGSGNQSFFGSTAQPAATGNIFGQPTSGMQPSGQSANIFGGASAFGAAVAPAPASLFGGAPSFGQTSGNIFSSANGAVAAAPVPATTNIFGQNSVFGGNSAAAQQSAFGAPTSSVFGATANSNMFGDQANVAQHQQQQNVFGAPVVSQSNVFGNSFAGTNSAFGAPAAPSSAFGAAALPVPAAVTTTTTTTMDGMSGTTNVFGTASTANSLFGSSSNANPFGSSQPKGGVGEAVAYSRIEDLTESEMQAFNAPAFQLGAIPVRPPPQQLCT